MSGIEAKAGRGRTKQHDREGGLHQGRIGARQRRRRPPQARADHGRKIGGQLGGMLLGQGRGHVRGPLSLTPEGWDGFPDDIMLSLTGDGWIDEVQ
jgi:hypothetical protein